MAVKAKLIDKISRRAIPIFWSFKIFKAWVLTLNFAPFKNSGICWQM